MPEVIVATPLKVGAVSCPYKFGDGISIQKIDNILWESAIAQQFVSPHERENLKRDRYWLCASGEYENVYGDVGNDLFRKNRHALWALQVICPSGAKNIHLKLVNTSSTTVL